MRRNGYTEINVSPAIVINVTETFLYPSASPAVAAARMPKDNAGKRRTHEPKECEHRYYVPKTATGPVRRVSTAASAILPLPVDKKPAANLMIKYVNRSRSNDSRSRIFPNEK